MEGIQFTFPDADSAVAGQLAQELRASLRDEGAPAESLTLTRERADSMDVGTALLLGAGLLFEHITATMVVHCIIDLCTRNNQSVSISTAAGSHKFGPGIIDREKLRSVVTDALNVLRRK